MILKQRFIVSVVPLGPGAPTRAVQSAVAELGHIPVDLVHAGILAFDPWDAVGQFISQSDYFVVAVGDVQGLDVSDVERTQRAFDFAVERHVPALALLPRTWSSEQSTGVVRSLLDKVTSNPFGMSSRYDSGDLQLAGTLGRLMTTYTRSGVVSTAEIPSDNVAEQLALLIRENQDLKRKFDADLGQVASRRREKIVQLLQDNKILIPLWYRGATSWGEPVEMSLYDFFLRLGSELAGEVSTEAAAEFIPVGVCGLEREDFRPRWPVPSNNLNLWLTDLMAIGVVEPSLRKRRSKDSGQYWTLTEEGRQLLSDIRRSVLSDGGHRHVGFTTEFRIVQDVDTDV